MSKEVLYIYVVYDHPLDYPEYWVVKRDAIGSGCVTRDENFILKDVSLDVIQREMERRGLIPMARYPDDDPVIYCTYI